VLKFPAFGNTQTVGGNFMTTTLQQDKNDDKN